MTYKMKRIFALIFLSCILLVGFLSIYRAALKIGKMKVVTGKVLDKKIEYFISYGSGRHYCLALHLANMQDKIAVNLGTKKQAEKDSAFYLIDIGKTYKFYLDPTVPTTKTGNWGIRRIDFNGVQIYKGSNKLNLYGGILISLICIAGIIIVLKYKRNKINS